MTTEQQAAAICEEWFPGLRLPPGSQVGGLHEAIKNGRAAQLKAEFEHIFRLGYSAGYNACTRENLAQKRPGQRNHL